MNKLKAVAFIVCAVVLCYVLMIAVMPVVQGLAFDVADQVEAAHDMDQYVAADSGLRVMPYVLWFTPGVIGIIALVITVRKTED